MTVSFIIAAIENTESRGVAIAMTGMFIVAVALSFITLFIAKLPRLLEIVNEFWPEVDEPHGSQSHPESLIPDDEAVLAAIGYVLHCEFQNQLQSEKSGAKKD